MSFLVALITISMGFLVALITHSMDLFVALKRDFQREICDLWSFHKPNCLTTECRWTYSPNSNLLWRKKKSWDGSPGYTGSVKYLNKTNHSSLKSSWQVGFIESYTAAGRLKKCQLIYTSRFFLCVHFHQPGPLGQVGLVVAMSRCMYVCMYVCCMSPPREIYFEASNWPSDHMITSVLF